MEIETRYYCSLNSNIRLNSDLTSYAKLVCAELLALADGVSITETNQEISELLHIPPTIFQEALDLLEAYNFISITHTIDNRVIKLENIAL